MKDLLKREYEDALTDMAKIVKERKALQKQMDKEHTAALKKQYEKLKEIALRAALTQYNAIPFHHPVNTKMTKGERKLSNIASFWRNQSGGPNFWTMLKYGVLNLPAPRGARNGETWYSLASAASPLTDTQMEAEVLQAPIQKHLWEEALEKNRLQREEAKKRAAAHEAKLLADFEKLNAGKTSAPQPAALTAIAELNAKSKKVRS